MNKSDETTTRTNARCLVNQPCSFVLQFRERGVDVRNLDCDMVHSRPAFSEKPFNGRIRVQRLEQLDVRVAHCQHAYLDALFRDFLGRIDFQTERIAPDGQTFFDALRGYSDVINFQQPE